ncbi:MAG: reprolysin-like metallopeptidase, partial [Ginsengibacter sp.]
FREYAKAVCPAGNVTVANTMSAIVTTMNRVNGVYQTELAIKLMLIAANASIVYTNPDTDPYSGNGDASTLINESQANITSVIGPANFDIGHTFSTGAGGLADQGSACNNPSKAKGITGSPDPVGDAYDIDFVAHEIGHQVGATHPFESEQGNCGNGNRIKLSAYEPGSGTTIMAYAGICGTDNIQPNTNPYFHTKSFDEIIAYTTSGTGSTCGVVTSTGNHAPVVVMPVSGIKIPKGTPFTLTGTATDIDGDALTYSWEEWDISNQDNGSAWNSGTNSTVKPLFKARIPKVSGSRTFPDMAVILANYPANPPPATDGLKGEILPQVGRDLKFRFVARDNKAGGGGVATGGNGCSSTAPFKVVVTGDGPFTLTTPNTSAINWLGGSTQAVTWNVANTNNAAGINAQNVDILMSTDGGNTYPRTVLANTPNDGNENIIVPNIFTNTTVRFMIKASDNIFFDISNENFTITFNPAYLEFSAKPGGNIIILTWEAVTEVNAKGFDILRSEGDSNNFVKIGFVAAAGSSGSLNNYTWNDSAVKKGVIYFYLLQQIDQNNNSLYSGIKSATIEKRSTFALRLQPQPFRKNAGLFLDGIGAQDFTILISDLMGRIVSKKEIKNSEENRMIPVNLNNQPSGLYFIRVFQNNIHKTISAVKL